jgi:signal transduction histidine kinase
MLQHIATVFHIKEHIRATPLARRIVLLTVILLGAVYAGNALILALYYGALSERESASRDTKAQLLAEHASRAMAAVDLSLETVVETLKARLPIKKPTIFTQVVIDKYQKNLPQVRALLVSDVDGLIVNNSRSFPPPMVNVADRLYFSEQKKWRGVGLYLDRIEISRVDHKPFFAMSRPVLDNDGNFQGIVAALIDPQYFAHLYDPHGEEASEFALLERDDGSALAGAGSSDEALIDRNHDPRSNVDQKNASIYDVHGFPARIVLVGKPIIESPQFATFVAMDLGLLIVMTIMALYLATRAARQATAVDREAQARRTAEARLLSAIESAPAGFALYDQDDRLVLSNDLFRSLFNPDKFLRPFKEQVEATLAQRVFADTGLKDGQEFPLRRAERDSRGIGEPILQLPDGRWILIRERRTKEGDTVSFYSDITGLKEREEELERLNQVHRLFVDALEHIPSSLMLCDPEDRVLFCNGATRQYFPQVEGLLVPGTPFEDLLRAQVENGYLRSATTNPSQWIEERMAQHRAGNTNAVRAYADERWAQVVERRTENGCTIGIRTDITEIKRKSEEIEEHSRELQRSNAELEQFAYVASHDLQEPLRMVASYCQLLQRRCKDKLDKDANEFIDFAVEGAKRMQQLINDLLNYSRVGRKSNGLAPVPVCEVANLALANLRGAISDGDVRIEIGDLPTVIGDRALLAQLLQNLISNAIKFRREEPPVIRIGATLEASFWHFIVEDNGIGIEPEYLERVFLIFQRLHERSKYPGTGIGLAIAKKVIERHGGRIWIDSVPGQGSRFHFTLPAAAGRFEAPGEKPHRSSPFRFTLPAAAEENCFNG